MANPNLYQSFWEKLLKKFGTAIFGHSKFIPVFLGKIVGKKLRTAIFGHSKFIPVFLGKIVGKNSEEPFLAIPNLYQSFWENKKFQNSHFWPFQICTSLFGKNCWKKLRMAIFGHSKFISVCLGKNVGKKSEQPFLAIPNLYQSVWEKLFKKIWKSHFWPFQIYSSLFGKNCWKKLRTAIFGHSKFIPVSLGKLLEKIEQPFLAKNLYQSVRKNCWEKFGMAIFGHSKFIPVFLGKIVGKKSEQPFLAIPNLYQSLWEKLFKKFGRAIFDHSKLIAVFLGTLLEKIQDSHFWPFQIYTSLLWEKLLEKI